MRRKWRHVSAVLLATSTLAACRTTPGGVEGAGQAGASGAAGAGLAGAGAAGTGVAGASPAPDAGTVVIGGSPDAGAPATGTPDAGTPDTVQADRPPGSDARPFVRADFGVTTDPKRPPPPVSGGTLAVLAGGTIAVAADPDRDHIYVADLTAWKVTFDVALQPGDEPGRVTEGPPGKAYVALRRAGAVVTIDTATGAITERRAVCSAPRGMAYDAATSRLHVACAGGELVSLPAAGATALRRLALPDDLRDVIVTEKGFLVSRFRSAEVLTVDAAGAVTARLRPKSADVRFSSAVAWRMRPMPGGGALLVHQSALDVAITIDGSPSVADPQHVGTYSTFGGGCGELVQTAVTAIWTDGTSSTFVPRQNVLTIDGVMDPRNGTAAIVHASMTSPGAASVNFVTLDSSVSQGCLPVSSPMPPFVELKDATHLDHPPGQTVAIDATPDRLLVQTREPATLWLDDGRFLTLSAERHADVGHAIFHSAVGGLACASCHPEGGEDGHVWKFEPIGSRRTPSLRGGIGGTEPFHWDGDLPTLSALVDEIWVRRMAGPPLAADQVGELRRWIDSIPALPLRAAGDATVVSRGRVLFEDATAACSTCHVGAVGTNNKTVDVGTGRPMQVPSLRGVAWRAPYMHDGCAATLADRFGACGGGDKHGHTSQLGSAQIADLVAYLQSL